VNAIEHAARRRRPERAQHLETGLQGERAAFFWLMGRGYVVVARAWHSSRAPGDLDIIAWKGDTLCFIEVKTRTTRDVKTAEAAVDRHKRQEIALVVKDYLRRSPPSCQWRFDVVSVYYGHPKASRPQIEVFRNSSLTA